MPCPTQQQHILSSIFRKKTAKFPWAHIAIGNVKRLLLDVHGYIRLSEDVHYYSIPYQHIDKRVKITPYLTTKEAMQYSCTLYRHIG